MLVFCWTIFPQYLNCLQLLIIHSQFNLQGQKNNIAYVLAENLNPHPFAHASTRLLHFLNNGQLFQIAPSQIESNKGLEILPCDVPFSAITLEASVSFCLAKTPFSFNFLPNLMRSTTLAVCQWLMMIWRYVADHWDAATLHSSLLYFLFPFTNFLITNNPKFLLICTAKTQQNPLFWHELVSHLHH